MDGWMCVCVHIGVSHATPSPDPMNLSVSTTLLRLRPGSILKSNVNAHTCGIVGLQVNDPLPRTKPLFYMWIVEF